MAIFVAESCASWQQVPRAMREADGYVDFDGGNLRACNASGCAFDLRLSNIVRDVIP